ncbi:hypothetical protein Tco_1308738 [Tanacetum coccineum]
MKSRKQSCYRENVPPSDKNIIPDSFPSQSSARKPSPNVGTRLKSPFPPRPNLPNPLKKKLMSDSHHDTDVSGSSRQLLRSVYNWICSHDGYYAFGNLHFSFHYLLRNVDFRVFSV